MSKLFEAFYWIEPTRENIKENFDNYKVLWNYPQDVSSLSRQYTDMPEFCFPDLEKIRIEKLESSRIEHYTFTLHDDCGGRVYGVCMRALFEGEGKRYDVRRRPRHCLCLITRQPFFATFRILLLEIHGLALISEDQSIPKKFIEILYNQPFSVPESSYLGRLKTQFTDSSNVSRDELPQLTHDYSLKLPHFSGSSRQDVPILPLLIILGVDRLMYLLNAVLTEKRIIFIAENVDTLSSTIHATIAMIYPFTWHHIFIPCLPSSLVMYAETPTPYLLGMKKYLYKDLKKRDVGDVLVVDVDSGDFYQIGRIKIQDFVGLSGTKVMSAVENLDMVKRKAADVFSRTFQMMKTVPSPAAMQPTDIGPRDVVNSIFKELNGKLAARPGASSIKGFTNAMIRTLPGSSSLEESKVEWEQDAEKTLRDCLLQFFVYLFFDLDDFANKNDVETFDSSTTFINRPNRSNTNGETFSRGGFRSAFDLDGFLNKRVQSGDSKDLQEFIGQFIRTQLFENFCRERYNKIHSNRSSRSHLKASTRKKYIEINTADFDDDEAYDIVLAEMTNCHFSATVANVKSAIAKVRKDQEEFQRDPERDEGNKLKGQNFHQFTVQFTSSGGKGDNPPESRTNGSTNSPKNVSSINTSRISPRGPSKEVSLIPPSSHSPNGSNSPNGSHSPTIGGGINGSHKDHRYSGKSELPNMFSRHVLFKRNSINPSDPPNGIPPKNEENGSIVIERSQSYTDMTNKSIITHIKPFGADDTLTEKRNSVRAVKMMKKKDESLPPSEAASRSTSSAILGASRFGIVKKQAVSFFAKQVNKINEMSDRNNSVVPDESDVTDIDHMQTGNEFAIEKICQDSHRSDLFAKIMCTILVRLRTCVTASGIGSAGVSGKRALILLYHLLVQGPESVLSYSFDFIPLIRALLRQQKKMLQAALQFIQGAVNLRPLAQSVLELLVDHKRLHRQRDYFILSKMSALPPKQITHPNIHKSTINSSTNNSYEGCDYEVPSIISKAIGETNIFPDFSRMHESLRYKELHSHTENKPKVNFRLSVIVSRSSLFGFEGEVGRRLL